MSDCHQMETLLAAFTDGELDPGERTRVERHLAGCPGCRRAASQEREVRELLRHRRARLAAVPAPRHLLDRLEASAGRAPAGARPWARTPLAIAATLVLAVSGVTLHLATGRSTTVLAAQLAADHVKCHLFEHDRGTRDARRVREQLATLYGFHAQVPPSNPGLELRLIGVRRCLTGKGTNAHILYRANGRPVSLYFVTHRVHDAHDVDVLGQQTHTWTRHNGTYVLVADPAVEGLPHIAAFLEASTREP